MFCDAPLEAEDCEGLKSGSLVKCQACEEINDNDAALEMAKEKAISTVKAGAEKVFNARLKNLFK